MVLLYSRSQVGSWLEGCPPVIRNGERALLGSMSTVANTYILSCGAIFSVFSPLVLVKPVVLFTTNPSTFK
jgi:hypothetical protein